MKSTLAPNWRYVLARARLSPQLEENRFKSELMRALTWQIGVEGIQATQASLISYDAKTGAFVLRCLRGSERRLTASLALIARLGDLPAHLESERISGTVAGLKRKTSKSPA
ncbi:Ribonuclease P protein component 2 [uncultured archaeon]|nr:Ribonuclease P protein component 2 [uncultured archaeon]